MNKVDQVYWNDSYKNLNKVIAEEDVVVEFIKKNIFPGSQKTAIEIGAYPGRYLAWIGKLGYRLSGIDTTPYINELPNWLKELGCSVGEFVHGDFLSHSFNDKYDLVYSI